MVRSGGIGSPRAEKMEEIYITASANVERRARRKNITKHPRKNVKPNVSRRHKRRQQENGSSYNEEK